MSEAVETLLLLCRCLRPAGAPGDVAPATGSPVHADQWTAVIDLANAHYLTPALWAALEEKGLTECLPADARDFLREAHRLNRARNIGIKEQAVELVGALNRADITPLVLKGGVYLFEGDQEVFDTRMMVDLDLLVPKHEFDKTVSVTRELGYEVLGQVQDGAHQYPPIWREGDPATVEIHHDVGKQRTLLSVEDAFRSAVPLDAEGLRVFALSPTHRIFHNIFHSEIQDGRYAFSGVSLRYLHDLQIIANRHGDQVDWATIRNMLERGGYGAVFGAYMYLGHRLLGFPLPACAQETFRTRMHLRWYLAQIRFKWVKAILSAWGVISVPFGRCRIEYIYGESRSALSLNVNRLRRAWKLIKHYKLGFLGGIAWVYRTLYSKQ